MHAVAHYMIWHVFRDSIVPVGLMKCLSCTYTCTVQSAHEPPFHHVTVNAAHSAACNEQVLKTMYRGAHTFADANRLVNTLAQIMILAVNKEREDAHLVSRDINSHTAVQHDRNVRGPQSQTSLT